MTNLRVRDLRLDFAGTRWINDAGYFIGPVCITNTYSVGMVHHGVIDWMLRQHGHIQT